MDTYNEKCINAYKKYLDGKISQTIQDSKDSLQRVYVETSMRRGKECLGVIARNVDTEELFFISQEELNCRIEGDGYIKKPFLGENIEFTREAMRYGENIGFPYTTMLIDIEQ